MKRYYQEVKWWHCLKAITLFVLVEPSASCCACLDNFSSKYVFCVFVNLLVYALSCHRPTPLHMCVVFYFRIGRVMTFLFASQMKPIVFSRWSSDSDDDQT